MVPSCVSEPTGCAIFFLIASTPAMNVVLTAPSPGIRTPSFPDGSSILTPFFTTVPPDKPQHYSPAGKFGDGCLNHRNCTPNFGDWATVPEFSSAANRLPLQPR